MAARSFITFPRIPIAKCLSVLCTVRSKHLESLDGSLEPHFHRITACFTSCCSSPRARLRSFVSPFTSCERKRLLTISTPLRAGTQLRSRPTAAAHLSRWRAPARQIMLRGTAPTRIAGSRSTRSIFLTGRADPPDNAARHRPDANRWLPIYKIDLTTGARVPVVSTPGVDNHDPALAGGNLYWARNVIRDSVAAVAVSGGDSKDVIVGAEVPMWSPDGKKISFTYGGWRLADWGLDLDAGYALVDADANRISARFTIVSGYHEDFPAAWSPDGKWIAFHSHRSKIPVPDYQSAESTDDIYLRLADDPQAPEIRLTDFGWETGPAFWSPDGRKLLFNSWVRGGTPGIDKLWVLGIQPVTGEVLGTTPLPLPAEIRSASWAAWSPDGKEIALEDKREGGN